MFCRTLFRPFPATEHLCSLTVTGSAFPLALGVEIQVLPGIRMPLGAVSNTRLLRRHSLPSKDVHAAGHRLQVIRVDAGAVAAEMVELMAWRYRPDQEFVGYAMGRNIPTIHRHTSIAPVADNPLPLPAQGSLLDAGPEQVDRRGSGVTQVCVPELSRVVHVTEAALASRFAAFVNGAKIVHNIASRWMLTMYMITGQVVNVATLGDGSKFP